MIYPTRCPLCHQEYTTIHACSMGGSVVRGQPEDATIRFKIIPPSKQEEGFSGCQPIKHLTEADIRRIVREELDARTKK